MLDKLRQAFDSPVDTLGPLLLQAEQLEERILMSATPLLVDGGTLEDMSGESMVGNESTIDASLDQIDQWLAAAKPTASTNDSQVDNTEASSPSVSTNSIDPSALHSSDAVDFQFDVSEIVFIHYGLFDSEALLADLRQQAEINGRELLMVTLESTSDGIDQVSDVLSRYADLAAIHFVTHGADATIQLGGAWLTADNLADHQATLHR